MRKRLPALLLTVLLAIGPSLTSCSRETPAPAEEIAVPAAPRPTAKPVAKPEPQPQPQPEPEPLPLVGSSTIKYGVIATVIIALVAAASGAVWYLIKKEDLL